MIEKPTPQQDKEIKDLWKKCFPHEDQRYIDYYFRTLYKEENCYVDIEDDKVVSVLMRNPHTLMFNGRPIRTSMILGVATLPEYQNQGHMKKLMDVVMDAVDHSELLTLVQTEEPALYEPYGFETVYRRSKYTLERKDVKRTTNYGCAYEPAPIDLLQAYSIFIKKFNGFYARDLEYFVNYKKEIKALGGKFVAYYDGKNRIQGYAAMIPQGNELRIDEIVYLDGMSLMKLCNACLLEKKVIHLYVSEAEDLSIVFPEAKMKTYPSTMVRLNNPRLFSRLFNKKVGNVKEAFAIGYRPLNLNESE